jgi:non-homologous end joining protein Ku
MIPGTGEEIEKREVVKGYEYSRGQFLTFTAEELKALEIDGIDIVTRRELLQIDHL